MSWTIGEYAIYIGLFWVIPFVWVSRHLRKKNAEIEAAWAEVEAWREASTDALTEWVRLEHGEEGVKMWKRFSRYTPPEVVRRCLPRPRESSNKEE